MVRVGSTLLHRISHLTRKCETHVNQMHQNSVLQQQLLASTRKLWRNHLHKLIEIIQLTSLLNTFSVAQQQRREVEGRRGEKRKGKSARKVEGIIYFHHAKELVYQKMKENGSLPHFPSFPFPFSSPFPVYIQIMDDGSLTLFPSIRLPPSKFSHLNTLF